MAKWPTINRAAKVGKAELLNAKTHELIPVPAYDLQGNLIRPEDYKSVLPGSVVRVGFRLTHWHIKERRNDPASNTFIADIESLRVLVKAPAMSPRRKTERTDPGILESPSKKAKNK